MPIIRKTPAQTTPQALQAPTAAQQDATLAATPETPALVLQEPTPEAALIKAMTARPTGLRGLSSRPE